VLVLFLQNEAKKYLFMNGLQFVNPAESQVLRDEKAMRRIHRAITDSELARD
jgi:hypothetical protein